MTTAILLLAPMIALAALVVARRHVRETTLIATWWWSVLALIAVALVEHLTLGQALPDEMTLAALRYAARTLLLCPAVSLLGAKRPQDGPWNFVVVSLWGILALPAAQSLLLNSGQSLQIGGFQAWFLLILLLISLANSLPTRHALSAAAAAVGIALLLNDYLPFSLPAASEWTSTAGFAMLALAAVLLAASHPEAAAASELDRLWLDFRDRFGLLWSLRMQERMQAAATMYRWPLALHWTGFITQGNLSSEQRAAVLTTFRGLLRRFVSNDWIDRRLDP